MKTRKTSTLSGHKGLYLFISTTTIFLIYKFISIYVIINGVCIASIRSIIKHI